MTTQPLTPAVTIKERRHAQRRKYRGNIQIEWGSAILEANVRDIGPGGLFAELVPPLWVGATFNARLLSDPVLLLQCTVARVEPARGVAVIFKVSEASGRAQLERLLQSLPTV
jgi:hypothetical protein